MYYNIFKNSLFITSIVILSFVIFNKNDKKKVVSYNKKKKLVVISFSRFTALQLERSKQIASLLPIDYNISFVTDRCSYIHSIKPYKVYCFTADDFMSYFKADKNMLGLCKNQQGGFYLWSMWLESVLSCIINDYMKYEYIWIMEGDLAYSGNIYNFFKEYDKTYSDLLSLPMTVMKNVSDWCWYDCYTYEYMKWIKSYTSVERFIAAINIVRISHTLYDYIMKNIKLNRHSHCESTLHETAIYNNLTISYIKKSDLGEKIAVGDRVSINEWNMFNKNSTKQNKLYHALKF